MKQIPRNWGFMGAMWSDGVKPTVLLGSYGKSQKWMRTPHWQTSAEQANITFATLTRDMISVLQENETREEEANYIKN